MNNELFTKIKSDINPHSSTDFLRFCLICCYKGNPITDDILGLFFDEKIIIAAKSKGIISFNEAKNRYDFPYCNYARKTFILPENWF